MTEPRTLPPFPVDRATLALLQIAVNPWAHDVQAECSSLDSFLEFMSEMGGSDTGQVEEDLDGTAVLDHPQYSINNLIEALVDEIERLRGERQEIALPEIPDGSPIRGLVLAVLLMALVVSGIIAALVNA